jgi:hypothetical protein
MKSARPCLAQPRTPKGQGRCQSTNLGKGRPITVMPDVRTPYRPSALHPDSDPYGWHGAKGAYHSCSVTDRNTATRITFATASTVKSRMVASAPPFWNASPPRYGDAAIATRSGKPRRPIRTG